MDDDSGIKALVIAILGTAAAVGGLSNSGGGASPAHHVVEDAEAWARQWNYTCHVQGTVDGDTVLCNDSTYFRLTLLDAPELSYGPIGHQARGALAQSLPPGSQAGIELEEAPLDTHGRIHGYLHTADGQIVNEAIARTGHALFRAVDPNTRRAGLIKRAETHAQRRSIGLWGEPAFECFRHGGTAQECTGAPAATP